MDYKVPPTMPPQPEGGYTVTSPLLPELITEGDTIGDTFGERQRCLGRCHRAIRRTRTSRASEHADTGHKWPGLVRDCDLDRVKYRDVTRKLTVLGCRELERRGGGSRRK